MKHIVINGNPSDGFRFTGPFDTAEAAINFAAYRADAEWWVAPIDRPTTEDGEYIDPQSGMPEGVATCDICGIYESHTHSQDEIGVWPQRGYPHHDEDDDPMPRAQDGVDRCVCGCKYWTVHGTMSGGTVLSASYCFDCGAEFCPLAEVES